MNTNNKAPKEIVAIPASKIIELDVRPILKLGQEPFSVIMKAISETPENGALKLRATFKPTPLFNLLGKQGWQHWIEFGKADDWIIWLYKSNDEAHKEISKAELGAAHLHKENIELQKRLRAEGDTWYLDVRKLPPPEPMELTLSVLEKLPEGARMVQINERVPQFLFPVLHERGFGYSVIQEKEGQDIRLEITRIVEVHDQLGSDTRRVKL